MTVPAVGALVSTITPSEVTMLLPPALVARMLTY